MQKSSSGERSVASVFLTVIFFFLGCIILRAVTMNVLVKRFGMSNPAIDLILFDVNNLNDAEDATVPKEEENQGATGSVIKWSELYPFDSPEIEERAVKTGFLEPFQNKIVVAEERIEKYSTEYLPWYREMTELANSYKMIIRWNMAAYSEYNSITQLEDQYFTSVVEQYDVSETAESTVEFARFCREQGADFIYVQQPSKISKYEDTEISGATDYSNQNMDDFLSILQTEEVDTYDHREDIHNEGLNHHALFYHTDHHWKAETGLWAAQHLLQFLNKEYGYDLNTDILNRDNFSFECYAEWFLGSQGKKVTLKLAKPEDICLIHPKFETSFHYVIPSLGIDDVGEFDLTYNMNYIKEKDYYHQNPFAAYNHADQPLIRFDNLLLNEGPRLLIIHKSYANCEIPFLALSIKHIDAIDLRFFTGSIRSFIKETDPDIVIVTYEEPGKSIDWISHEDVFDFR